MPIHAPGGIWASPSRNAVVVLCNLSYLLPRKPDRALERSEMPDAGKVDSVNVSPSQSAKAVVVLHARTVELG